MAATNKCLAQSNKSCTTPGERRRFAFAAPENFTAPNADCPLSSDLPIRRRPGMNPSHDCTDEQMFGAAQQVLHRAVVD